jgi:hypothetical protein
VECGNRFENGGKGRGNDETCGYDVDKESRWRRGRSFEKGEEITFPDWLDAIEQDILAEGGRLRE